METSRPSGIRKSTAYLPEIESLRGVAIALVFLSHGCGIVWPMSALGVDLSLPRALIVGGGTGVSLFFVLSGFLLSLPFLDEAAGGRRVIRRDYYVRRALRILPVYYTAVLVATLLKARAPADLLRGLPFLFFLKWFNNDQLIPYSSVWWSLTTEVHFYLFLPLLPLAWRAGIGRRVALAVLVAYLVAYGIFLTNPVGVSLVHHEISHSFLALVPVFGCGILAAWVYRTYGSQLASGRLAHARSRTEEQMRPSWCL